jgi:hypothetical protein
MSEDLLCQCCARRHAATLLGLAICVVCAGLVEDDEVS